MPACERPGTRLSRMLAAVALAVGLGAVWTVQAGNIYRWQDAQGVVHYDQSLPDAAVDRGYEVLDSSGEIIRSVPPPPTPAQRAAKAAQEVAERKAEQAREARQRHDQILLQTFDSVAGIERMRDERLGALDVQIRLAKDRVSALKNHHETDRIPAAEAALDALQSQREEMSESFEADIKRFRELTGKDSQ